MANEDKATRYHRLRRRVSLISTALSAVLLLLLTATGGSAVLRDAAASLTGGNFILVTVCFVVALAMITEVVQLPLAFYQGVTLERRYGLSTESTLRWGIDQAKAFAVGLVFALLGAVLVMTFLRASPERWWLMAAACFTLVMVVLAQLAPVLLLPLFYEFKPLERDELVQRLVALADRAGTRVLGVFEWRMSDRTRKANAALTGLGSTRRILVSDTLLAEHSDEEIEVILAHELAHHVHHDIWTGIAVEAILICGAFYVGDRTLEWAVGSFGIISKSDPAVLPLLLLAAGAVSLLVMPVFNVISRSHERRADRYALEMTRNAPAFVSAMKRLSAQNLAEERPSLLVALLFHSHPSISARIDAAQAWAARTGRT